MSAGGVRRTTFKQLRRYSSNMLALAIGHFRRLQRTADAAGREIAVWALPGAEPTDAALSLRVLEAAVPGWEELTGAELPGLGKLDMLVWNGASPWSSSQMGLLWMDRFRTIWNAELRRALARLMTCETLCSAAACATTAA